MFWSDTAENSQAIMSANMDGSNVTKLFPRSDAEVTVEDPKSKCVYQTILNKSVELVPIYSQNQNLPLYCLIHVILNFQNFNLL